MLGLRLYAALGITAVIGLFIYLGYNHYTNLITEVEQQKLLNQQLKISLESGNKINEELNTSIILWKESQDRYVERMEELRQISVESSKEVRRLNDIFSKHNLTRLALGKPKLIENRINTGTDVSNRMLECASGSRDKSCGSRNRKTE